jgi:hypothetical protein
MWGRSLLSIAQAIDQQMVSLRQEPAFASICLLISFLDSKQMRVSEW